MGIVNLEIVALVIKSLLHRKVRTFLTTLGIIIGVALVFSLVSLNGGMKASIIDQMDALGSDVVTIMGKPLPGLGLDGIFTSGDIEVVERLSSVQVITGLYMTGMDITIRDKVIFKALGGLEPDKIELFADLFSGFGVDKGRFLYDYERGKIVVGPLFAEDHNLGIGSRITIGEEAFRIVGIMEPVGNGEDDRNIYMNAEDLWELNGIDDIFIVLFGKVHEPKVEAIERALEKYRGQKDFEVMTSESMMSMMDSILDVVNAVFLAVASISILVGSIGVANTMYVSVLERVGEIGVLKAIGATKNQILFMFLLEAGLVGIIGGIIGIILGYSIAFGFTYAATASGFMDLKPLITPALFLVSAGSAFVVGMIAGFVPARWAANLEPVEALRYE
ncbi:MAG: ABC transporter permease [Candidatus Altiarchaeota archaeon]|nr:ABC transporter permease [Candidatus Altiarchaeota archaeon]